MKTKGLLSKSKPYPISLIASICAIVFVLISSTNQFASAQTALSAYDILRQYGFPVGLLPQGVTGYELNRGTGEFKVYLSQTCKFTIESYQLEYKPTITGVITRNRLSNLKGVSVKVLILWLNIVEVVHEADEIQFSVGIASANFEADGFDVSPQCGCGFDCNDLGSLVSST